MAGAVFTAEEIARLTGGVLHAGVEAGHERADGTSAATSFHIDSRTVVPGGLFVALPGQRDDGHAHVADAFRRGAVGALVRENGPRQAPAGRFLVQVDDAARALGRLARAHRDRFELPLVGVTGSLGKTTTKDLLAAALSPLGPVLKTEKNLNTELGVPLALLGLEARHRAAVVEMAMRGPGQIAWLAEVTRPTAGVITHVGPVHLELLGSLEAIERAKGELFAALPEEGWALAPAGDARAMRLLQRAGARRAVVRLPGESLPAGGCDAWLDLEPQDDNRLRQHFRFRGRGLSGELEGECQLDLPGRPNLVNAGLALATACVLGIDPQAAAQALAQADLSAGRLTVHRVAGVQVIDDSYNAAPASVRAALEVLSATPARRRIAVLGNMLELGDYSRQAHREVGQAAAEARLDLLITVGDLAREILWACVEAGGIEPDQTLPAEDPSEAAADLLSYVQPGDAVLVKGSRGVHLERVVQALLDYLKQREEAARSGER